VPRAGGKKRNNDPKILNGGKFKGKKALREQRGEGDQGQGGQFYRKV